MGGGRQTGGRDEAVKGSRRTGDADGRAAEGVEVLVARVLAGMFVSACANGSKGDNAYVL